MACDILISIPIMSDGKNVFYNNPLSITTPSATAVRQKMRYDEEDEDEGPKADPTLEQGMPLPIRLNAVYPPELTAVPIEDIDPYYRNQRVKSSPSIISPPPIDMH